MKAHRCMVFVVAVICACEEPYSNDDLRFIKSLPDETAVRIDLPERDVGAAPEGVAKYYLRARTISETVNPPIADLLHTIQQIAAAPPSVRTGDRREWGPFAEGSLEYVLTVTRTATAGIRVPTSTITVVPIRERYDFTVTARIKAEPSTKADFIGGQFAAIGAGGIGWLQINFEAYRWIDPTREERGYVGAGYDTRSGVDLGLVYYLPDAESPDPDAYYRLRVDALGNTDFYFASYVDVEAGGGPAVSALETSLLYARWRSDRRGRADVVVFGGDLPQERPLVSAECWDDRFVRVYFRTILLDPDPPFGELGDCAPEHREPIYFPN